MLSPSHASAGAAAAVTTLVAHDPALLLAALGGLVASQSLSELAAATRKLCEAQPGARRAVVVLQDAQGEVVGQTSGEGELEAWALDLLGRVAAPAGPTSSGQRLGVRVDAPEAGVRGVIALDLASASDDESERQLAELGRLVATCVDQTVSRLRSAQALKDAQASLAKGLHDLRTPLNSLRLGMHLLEPGLANQDPAIVQRTHRAVDRMATLVTEMFDALHKDQRSEA